MCDKNIAHAAEDEKDEEVVKKTIVTACKCNMAVRDLGWR